MRETFKNTIVWGFRIFIVFVVILTGAFLYQVWNTLVRLGSENLATLCLVLIGTNFLLTGLAFRLGRSDAFHFIRGFDTGTERTVGVMAQTKGVATGRSVQQMPVRLERPTQIVQGQLGSGEIVNGEVIDL